MVQYTGGRTIKGCVGGVTLHTCNICMVRAISPARILPLVRVAQALLPPDVVKAGTGQGMKLKWIQVDKATKDFTRQAAFKSGLADDTKELLQKLAAGGQADDKICKELSKRKLIIRTKVFSYSISKGPKFGVVENLGTTLTDDMLRTGEWKTLQFKPYNLNAAGSVLECGYLHPLMKVRTQFREVFLELGFEEMPTVSFGDSIAPCYLIWGL